MKPFISRIRINIYFYDNVPLNVPIFGSNFFVMDLDPRILNGIDKIKFKMSPSVYREADFSKYF